MLRPNELADYTLGRSFCDAQHLCNWSDGESSPEISFSHGKKVATTLIRRRSALLSSCFAQVNREQLTSRNVSASLPELKWHANAFVSKNPLGKLRVIFFDI